MRRSTGAVAQEWMPYRRVVARAWCASIHQNTANAGGRTHAQWVAQTNNVMA